MRGWSVPLLRHLSLAWLLIGAVTVQAQTGDALVGAMRYVDDVLTITVRTGRGTDFQIIRTIESGLPLVLLENGSDGYSRVRLPDGAEGWVLTRYLTERPPARERLPLAEQRAAEAGAQLAELRQRVAELQAENDTIKLEMARLYEERQSLDGELERLRAALGDPSAAPARLELLRGRVEELGSEAERLRIVNLKLRDDSQRYWFMVGAAVLLGGILLGVLLPRLRPRKRSSWGSL